MRSARILLAEEDQELGRSLQKTLIDAGYSVPAVWHRGSDALEQGLETNPGLALISTTLPGNPDGLETARRLRKHSRIPILLLASAGQNLSLNQAQAPLASNYLVRPVADKDLLDAIAGFLQLTGSASSHQLQHRAMEQTLTGLADGVVATDLAGIITYLNPQAANLAGATPEDALGQSFSTLFTDVGAVAESAPLEDSDGSMHGTVHIFHGLPTGRPSSENGLELLSRSISDPLFTLDGKQSVTHLNSSAAALLNTGQEQVLGHSIWSLIPSLSRDEHEEKLSTVHRQRAPYSLDLRFPPATAWWKAQVYPFGEGFLLLLQDHTEQKERQADAERIYRLEALGHLARGFSHEFNNLLTVLMGNLSLARAQAGSGELDRQLQEAEGATSRAQDLVEQLTTFAKGGAPIKGMVPLRPLLNQLLVDRPAASRISYDTHFEGTEFTLDADPRQLRRLLENLLLNAEQAIAGSGEISIRCFRPSTDKGGEPFLHVEVRDSGAGMTSDTMDQAVEPFFTTRTKRNATGLGLTVCDSIARAHGGSLSLHSRPGEGTTVTVRLPIHGSISGSPPERSARPAKLNGHAPSLPAASNPKRILVLEDESLIRRLIHSTLTQAGFQVDETSDGSQTVEAFRKARDAGDPYDLLIMDLTIENGMGGVEAMNRIRNLDPEALAIVSSGYSDDPAMSRPDDYGFSSVLPKPYQPTRLIEVVESILAPSGTN